MSSVTPPSKRVLVTGASGFIGRLCVQILADHGWDVWAASYPLHIQTHAKQNVEMDLLTPGACRRDVQEANADTLLHLAWHSGPGFYHASENERWVEASLGLYKEFIACGGQRIVTAGTCAEYDWSEGICHEDSSSLNPSTSYGRSKVQFAEHLTELLPGNDISAAWTRIFFLYGPGEAPEKLVASVIQSLLRGEPALCSHGEQIRDYVFIRDTAEMLVGVLESPFEGTVNIASGKRRRVKDVVRQIAESLGREDLIRLGAIETPPDDPPIVLGDTKRLQQILGEIPHTSLASGIEESITWWKQQPTTSRESFR